MLLRATGGDDNDRFSGEMNAAVAWIRGVRWSNFCRVLGNYGRNMALFSSLFFFWLTLERPEGYGMIPASHLKGKNRDGK